jgi:hypothetical protein
MVQPPPTGTATCHADSDCAAAGVDQVCEQVSCDLSIGMSCVPGCAGGADCGEGETCSPAHHCVPSSCAGGCPALFACDATSTCSRRKCSTDSDCPAHAFCVDLQCYGSLGQCGLID